MWLYSNEQGNTWFHCLISKSFECEPIQAKLITPCTRTRRWNSFKLHFAWLTLKIPPQQLTAHCNQRGRQHFTCNYHVCCVCVCLCGVWGDCLPVGVCVCVEIKKRGSLADVLMHGNTQTQRDIKGTHHAKTQTGAHVAKRQEVSGARSKPTRASPCVHWNKLVIFRQHSALKQAKQNRQQTHKHKHHSARRPRWIIEALGLIQRDQCNVFHTFTRLNYLHLHLPEVSSVKVIYLNKSAGGEIFLLIDSPVAAICKNCLSEVGELRGF